MQFQIKCGIAANFENPTWSYGGLVVITTHYSLVRLKLCAVFDTDVLFQQKKGTILGMLLILKLLDWR